MSGLLELLRENIKNRDRTTSGVKEGIYEGILVYLEDHAVVSTRELKSAFDLIKKQGLIGEKAYSVDCCNSGSNPWIKTSKILRKIGLKDVTRRVFGDKHPGFEIDTINPYRERGSHITFYYVDEEKMLNHIKENVKLVKRVLYFKFNPDT